MSRRNRLVPVAGWVVFTVLASVARADEPKAVVFETDDAVQIHADFYAPGDAVQEAPMAILLHMYRSDREAWRPLARRLSAAGFAVLAIDMRGHGDSATPELRDRVMERDVGVFEDMYQDVRAAYDWMAEQGGVDRSRFGLVGASVGCSVALRYAVQDKSVDAVVCLTPGLDYLGLDSVGDAKKIKGRRLLMLATEDEAMAAKRLASIVDGGEARIVAPGKIHGTNMFGKVDGVEKTIVDFLTKAVGPPTKTTVFGSIRSNIWHPPESGWIERIKPTNMRYYSSPEEAEARGLRKTKSMGPADQGRRQERDRGQDNP